MANQGRSCRYLDPLNTHLTNRNKKSIKMGFSIPIGKRGPVKCTVVPDISGGNVPYCTVLFVLRACVYAISIAIHPFYLWVSCASLRPTNYFRYLLGFNFSFLSFCRFCLVFGFMLSLELSL